MDLDDRRRSRRSALLGAGSLVLTTVVMIVVLLGVDLGDEPAPDTLAPTTVAPTTTDLVPDTSPAIDYTPTEPPVTPAKPTTTTITPTTIPLDQRIVVASPAGITAVIGSSSESIDSGSWAVAISSGDGSIIAQHVWPGYGQPGDTAIYRIADNVASTLVAPSDPANEWIRLHDVIDEAGSVRVLYSVKSGTGFDVATEELLLLNISTGTTQSLGVIGGWEDGPGRLSIGGNLIVGETFSQIDRGPFIRRRDGTNIDPGSFGLATTYADCSVCPRTFAIDETGSNLVWVEDDLLVVMNVDTGERVTEVRLVEGLGRDIDTLEISGETVIVNAHDRNTGVLGRPYLYGFDGTSARLPVEGSATFAR